jgi:hypothetical protein
MADRTKRFRFTVLNAPADRLDSGNYKFSDADRVLLDRLLTRAIEHNHTGIQVEADRYAPPALTVSTTGGALPPNRGVYYRYAIVDRTGQEFVASPIVTLFTPTQVSAPPFAPRLSTEQSGSLEEGTYVYALSACTGDNRQETLLSPTASITTAGVGGCRVDFPPPPSGAEFFNVYRQGPREPELLYLTTMGPDDRYLVEDGNNRTDPLRTSPQANTTHTANSVQITLPADVLPAGGSWKLYRSYDPAHWDNSLLDWIGAFASYIDDGRATRAGVPPESSAAVGGAPKIRLGIDTTGTPTSDRPQRHIPPGHVQRGPRRGGTRQLVLGQRIRLDHPSRHASDHRTRQSARPAGHRGRTGDAAHLDQPELVADHQLADTRHVRHRRRRDDREPLHDRELQLRSRNQTAAQRARPGSQRHAVAPGSHRRPDVHGTRRPIAFDLLRLGDDLMPRYTSRWGLSVLGSGDSFQSDGFKFTDADRRLIDRLLTYAAEQHHHTGERSENLTPTAGPTLNLSTSGGTLASGARFYYRYTIVDDIGNETGPSPMGFIDTPATIETPGAPALAYLSGTGGLEPGGYSYVLSAYRGASTQETKAINSSLINITGAYPTNEVTLTLPAPPPGADGLNVYRRTPRACTTCTSPPWWHRPQGRPGPTTAASKATATAASRRSTARAARTW